MKDEVVGGFSVVDKQEISRKGAKPRSCRREEETNGRSQAVDLEELKSILRCLALIFFCVFAAWREI